jgi:hypothetical protein
MGVDRYFRCRIRTRAALFRTSNESSSTIKRGEFRDYKMNCYLFKKVSLRGVRRGKSRCPICRMSVGIFMISSLRHEVAENCGLLGYYAASSGNLLPTVRYILSVNPEDVTDRLYRPVGRKFLGPILKVVPFGLRA